MTKKPLVVIVGPTAVGKTAISIELARLIDGEIISADSRLFYRRMNIGTAKPAKAEMESIPHHMIDIIDPDQPYSLGQYLKDVRLLLKDIWQRGKVPLLVGGTGQYIMGVVDGWLVPEQEPDHRFRKYFQKLNDEIGYQKLYEVLLRLDPAAADKIDPPNVRRTIRALEVIFLTGERFSTQKRREEPGYHILRIGLNRPREELYQRIDQRVDLMMESGLLQEVQGLIEQYPDDLPAFSAIGYVQIIQYLKGEITLDQAIELIKRKTRQFVRRQANWFKADDPRIHWFHPDQIELRDILELIQEHMS